MIISRHFIFLPFLRCDPNFLLSTKWPLHWTQFNATAIFKLLLRPRLILDWPDHSRRFMWTKELNLYSSSLSPFLFGHLGIFTNQTYGRLGQYTQSIQRNGFFSGDNGGDDFNLQLLLTYQFVNLQPLEKLTPEVRSWLRGLGSNATTTR